MTFGITGAWFPKHRSFVPQKNSKILPTPKAARKNLCMFLFPRSLLPKLIVAMATALVDTGAFERRKLIKEMVTKFAVHLLLVATINNRIPASSGIVEHQNDGSIDRLLPRFRRLTNHCASFHFAKKQRHSCDKQRQSIRPGWGLKAFHQGWTMGSWRIGTGHGSTESEDIWKARQVDYET